MIKKCRLLTDYWSVGTKPIQPACSYVTGDYMLICTYNMALKRIQSEREYEIIIRKNEQRNSFLCVAFQMKCHWFLIIVYNKLYIHRVISYLSRDMIFIAWYHMYYWYTMHSRLETQDEMFIRVVQNYFKEDVSSDEKFCFQI